MGFKAVDQRDAVDAEATAARVRRLALEAKLIEDAREDLRVRGGLSGPALDAWLERFARGDQDLAADDETRS